MSCDFLFSFRKLTLFFFPQEVSLLSPSFGFFQSFQPTPQTSHFAFLHKTSTFSFARPSVLYTSSVTSETLSIPNWVPKTREPSPPQPFWKMDGNKGEEENYAAGAVVKVLEEVESCRKENSPVCSLKQQMNLSLKSFINQEFFFDRRITKYAWLLSLS